MEITGEGSVYGNDSFFQSKPQIPAIEKFLSSSHSKFSNQQSSHSNFSNQQNHHSVPFYPPSVFPDFTSSFSAHRLPPDQGSFCSHGFLPYAEVAWNQNEQINTSSDEVNSSAGVVDPTQRKEKGKPEGLLVKGQWTDEEDRKLILLVKQCGSKNWTVISEKMVGRAGKQCRERWLNHLRPDIKKDSWSEDEEKLLIELHKRVGNKWAEIAKHIPGRTENSIKNHWNATKRRQISMGRNKKLRRGVNGKQPTLLQDYIKSKCFGNGSGSISTSTTSDAANASVSTITTSRSNAQAEAEGDSFFTFETCDEEEMSFMRNLFESNINDSSNIDASTVEKGRGQMNPSSAQSESNILQVSHQDTFLYPEMLDAAFAVNMSLPMNQVPSFAGRLGVNLTGISSSSQCSDHHPTAGL